MANHCTNNIRFYTTKEELDKNNIINGEDFNYKEIYGDEIENTNESYIEKAGTKWTVIDEVSEEEKTTYMSVTSAWGPPNLLLKKILDKYGIESENEYEEPGMGFEGTFSCMKDMVFDDEREYIPYCDYCGEKMDSTEEADRSLDEEEREYKCDKCREWDKKIADQKRLKEIDKELGKRR